MTDADYLFGEGALDAIAERFDSPLAYARRVWKCSPELGDSLIANAQTPDIRTIDRDWFAGRAKLGRAIGGCQIYDPDMARQHGYLPKGHKLLREPDEWQRTHCDTAFRRYLGNSLGVKESRGVGLDIPNVMRIRHTRYGRKDRGTVN